MKNTCLSILSLAVSIASVNSLADENKALSKTTDQAGKERLEEVIATGTRASERTLFETMAPVDVLSESSLTDVSSGDLADKLSVLAPSYNVKRLPMADGKVFVRPASLRALSPDHTLVLINGKRWHRSALLSDRGSQAPDLSKLPTSAIKRIEVLRDGAAAQYGSDALAGVINIILADDSGISGFTQAGEYYEGDGDEFQSGLRGGMALGEQGHITASIQGTSSAYTSRTNQRADAIQYEQDTGISVNDPVQRWGQPDTRDLRGSVNADYNLGAVKLYGFAVYGEGQGWSDFNWRNPATAGAYGDSASDPAYDLLDIYPGGFSPRFGQKDKDTTATVGVSGKLGEKTNWDASVTYGQNEIDYYMHNSINASLGSASPTGFYLGELKQTEITANLDFDYMLYSDLFAYPANISYGLESRKETYEISAGEYASYAIGDLAEEGFPSGSNGFPGFNPQQEGSWDQDSYAGYIDTEMPLTEKVTTGLALRYEDYSEFGDTFDGKASFRYEFNDSLALRSTFSTGFKAPTPGQLYSENISQGLDSDTLTLYTSGRVSPTSPVAKYFGAKDLKPEESQSYSVGMTFQSYTGLTATLDVYQIDVDDRMGQSQNYAVDDAVRADLAASGYSGADSVSSVSFYTNAFDTRTTGVDLTAGYNLPLTDSELRLTAAVNYNETDVEKEDGTLGEYNTNALENGQPNWKGNISAVWAMDEWEFMARARYYGEWTDFAETSATGYEFQDFAAMTLFDASVTWNVMPELALRLGAENLFDEYPDQAIYQANRGLKYSRNSPYDTDGGQYYLRADYQF
ncbi:MAG: TonB-dependent receptor [Oceanospirillaceae bacterium]|nr:TonB-dependent receptor [Oceanospirillaceae bacterium]MBT13597.1 TonB-dependent receptor [Oceanospirillaceae bacterium]|tara:strand:+ start:7785 stop:10193 length:2409 start_codon:yes stop_codon:yes gene_type:complete